MGNLPNIRSLFRHYDELYFGSKLEACTVEWTSRRTVDPGRCIYKEDGTCQIRLSEPVLKSRSEGDLKATLLHEMIHAYLFFTVKSEDRNDHGDFFRSKMNKINNSQLQDDERPEEGYHIGVTHSFEAVSVQHWKCQTCGDTIEKDGDTAPSAADCIGKSNSSESCLRLQCRWHMHKKGCSGTYVKGSGVSGDRGAQAFEGPNGKQELTNNAIKRKLQIDVKSKAGEVHWKAPRLEWFYTKGQIAGEEQPCKSSDVKSGISAKQLLKGARVKRSPRRRITKKAVETTHSTSSGPPVIIGWKGWWALEREEDEEGVESLIDRRREKRAREKESQGVMKLADECAKIQVEGTSAIEVEAEPDSFQHPDHENAVVTWQPVIDLESPRREGTPSEGERALVLASVPTLKTYSRRRGRKGANTGDVTTDETEAKCPVCQKVFVCDPNKPQDNADINTHVDECLNASFRVGR